MKHKNVWKFKSGDKAFDKIYQCVCEILVANNSNDKLERRYYVKTVSGESPVIEWRSEEDLSEIGER